MTATLAPPKPAEPPTAAATALAAPRRRDRLGGGRQGRRGVLVRLALSTLVHAAVFGALAMWAIDREVTTKGQGLHLQILHTPDLVAETLETDDDDVEVPELEDIPVFAAFEPAPETPQEEEPIEDDTAFLPALDPAPTEADLAMHDLSVAVVHARTRREVAPPPAPRRQLPTRVIPVVARPAPRLAATPPRPHRASGGSPRGRLTPVHMPRAYPDAARRMGLEGRAIVLVTINAGGRVVNAELVTSAGHPILDAAALSSARAWRFQAPGETRRLSLPFIYQLR